jgi:hypothetical protein
MTPLPEKTEAEPIVAEGGKDTDDYLYLTGRPSLRDFLKFVRNHDVDAPDEGTLTDEWRAAEKVVRALEAEEAGIADNPPIEKIGSEYEPLLIEFLKDPLIRHGFNTLPTEVAFVDLDRLVVWQKHIDLTHSQQLEARMPATPSPEDIFRICLRHDRPEAPVKWDRLHRDSFVFVSPSNDLRFLGSMRLDEDNITDYPPPGDLVGVIGLAVGFGRNFLNAIYAENRLILNNGSHRAYALRKRGFTRVPCIIQHVSSREELKLVATAEVDAHPDNFLKRARPMMLRDYFNPQLHRLMAVRRRLRQITVKFDIDEAFIPAL